MILAPREPEIERERDNNPLCWREPNVWRPHIHFQLLNKFCKVNAFHMSPSISQIRSFPGMPKYTLLSRCCNFFGFNFFPPSSSSPRSFFSRFYFWLHFVHIAAFIAITFNACYSDHITNRFGKYENFTEKREKKCKNTHTHQMRKGLKPKRYKNANR